MAAATVLETEVHATVRTVQNQQGQANKRYRDPDKP